LDNSAIQQRLLPSGFVRYTRPVARNHC